MKNISSFITEKLKVSVHTQELPTWKEFTGALYDFPGKTVILSNFCEDFEDAKIKDYPTFVNHGIERYPESGHIMELHADSDTKRYQTITIYFKYEQVPDNFITIMMYSNEYNVLVDSLGEDLYVKIYNKLREYYRK